MKKNQVNEILPNQTRRRNVVILFVISIISACLISFIFFTIYYNENKNQYINYDENSKIDYKVFYKSNEFFNNNYLESNKQYIASLIDYVKANFNYKLSLAKAGVEYKYSYRIEAEVDVKEKGTSNSLYSNSEVIVDNTEKITSSNEVIINENIDIDYNHYNDLIKKFVSIYDLDDTESMLNINMYVNVLGTCEEFEDDNEKASVMTLSIPLTTKTMAIDIGNNLIDTENNIMLCKETNHFSFIFLLLGIIFAVSVVVLIVLTIKYEIKTRTAENIYEKELKKILNNYSSYIQKLSDDFEFKNYNLLKVDTFTDMLEIRDTIRQPILMKENDAKTGAYFVIPSNSKLLYIYRLKVSDIKKEIQKNAKNSK